MANFNEIGLFRIIYRIIFIHIIIDSIKENPTLLYLK